MCKSIVVAVGSLLAGFAVVAVVWPQTLWAQTANPTQAPKVPDNAEIIKRMEVNKGVLYKATRNNKTIHLFGTLHVGKELFLPLGKLAVGAALTSEKIFLELDLLDPDLTKKYNQLVFADKPFAFTPKQIAAIAKYAPTTGQSAQDLMKMRPFHVISMLSLGAAKSVGLSIEYGSEAFFMGLAQSRKIPIGGLETLEEQLGFANKLSATHEAQMIDETLASLESGEASQLILELANSWQKGDIAGLGNAYQKSMDKGDLMTKMFDQEMRMRNRTMVKRIVEHSNRATAPIFVGVGALHFWGPDNMADLLQGQGFKVEKLH